MKKPHLKIKQLDNTLSDKIQHLYESTLKHELTNVSYRLCDKSLIVILEGTITPTERLLKKTDHQQLAQQVRTVIDQIIKPQIKIAIEEVMKVKVIDFLCDTTMETEHTGAIAILEFQPLSD